MTMTYGNTYHYETFKTHIEGTFNEDHDVRIAKPMMNTTAGLEEITRVKDKIRFTVKEKIGELPVTVSILLRRCILTGGAISSIFHSEDVNDWDLLFLFSADLNKFRGLVYDLSVEKFILDIDPNYTNQTHYKIDPTTGQVKAVTDWAVTFKNKVQVILRTAEHRKTFDFVHTMPYYDITQNKFFISAKQYDSIVNKKLIKNPDGEEVAQSRIDKYVEKGWSL
jgi:hypothetical protein